MRTTGIIRRIDDLGRLVIPKEIRKLHHLKEGDSVEFYIEEDSIVLRKFESLSKQEKELYEICETLTRVLSTKVYFVTSKVIASQKELSKNFYAKCQVYRITSLEDYVFESDTKTSKVVIYPVVVDGYWRGSFVVEDEAHRFQKEKCIEAFVEYLTRKINI